MEVRNGERNPVPETQKDNKEKTFYFEDVQENDMGDRDKLSKLYRKRKMISHKQAPHLDATIQDVMLKYFKQVHLDKHAFYKHRW